MLVLSTLAISAAIFSGFLMARFILAKKPVVLWLKFVHVGMVAAGALLAIIAAFQINKMQVWGNIALSVIVALLGIIVGLKKTDRRLGKPFLTAHGILAIICYLGLVYNTVVL